MIIIQPQAPSSTEGSPGAQADIPAQEAPLDPASPSQKKDEDPEVRSHPIIQSAADLRSDELTGPLPPQKIAFMVALGLVTTEHLEGELTPFLSDPLD